MRKDSYNFYFTYRPFGHPKKNQHQYHYLKLSQVDITSILKIHVDSFKNKKFSTVQKNVGEAVQNINWKDPNLEKFNNKALGKFFFVKLKLPAAP